MLVFTNMSIRRRKDTLTRQAEIVEAALDIIGAFGVRGVTTARLAEKLGMSEPNLYRHFNDKDAILCGVVDEIGKRIMEKARLIASAGLTPSEKLKAILESHVREIEQKSGIPRLVFSEEMHIHGTTLRDKLSAIIRTYLAVIEGVLEEGITKGEFRRDIEVYETARTYLGMVQFSAMRWSLSEFSFSLKDESGRLWENFYLLIKR